MEARPRPLGLSILAITNFCLALYQVQAVVQLGAVLLARLGVITLPLAIDPLFVTFCGFFPRWFLEVTVVASTLQIALLATAGVGYFQLRRMGRWAATGFAAVALGQAAVAALALPYGFGGGNVVLSIFALVTLAAVHTMYRTDLTR
jgi:hypothetical protein